MKLIAMRCLPTASYEKPEIEDATGFAPFQDEGQLYEKIDNVMVNVVHTEPNTENSLPQNKRKIPGDIEIQKEDSKKKRGQNDKVFECRYTHYILRATNFWTSQIFEKVKQLD